MKKYFFFILFFIFIFNEAWSKQNKSTSQIKGCSYNINENYLEQLDRLTIKLIEVEINQTQKIIKFFKMKEFLEQFSIKRLMKREIL